jgi:hypothetical protein
MSSDKINSWYRKGEITADMVKGIFEHRYIAAKDTTTQETIYGHVGFNIRRESRSSGKRKYKRRRKDSEDCRTGGTRKKTEARHSRGKKGLKAEPHFCIYIIHLA